MNLKELIELNENRNDEELNEGLRIFKKSKQFRKYADKIEAKLVSSKSKGKIDSDKAKMIQEIITEARMASKEFERVEDKFKGKEFDRKKAKEEISRLKKKYSGLVKKLKSDKVKNVMKIIGGAALAAGLLVGLNEILYATGVIKPTTTIMTGSDFSPGRVYNFDNMGN